MAKEKEELTFEDKIKLLEEIVKELESGEVPLDDAINKYTEAMKLAKECSDKLNKVSEKVNKIMLENGKLEDFTISEYFIDLETIGSKSPLKTLWLKRIIKRGIFPLFSFLLPLTFLLLIFHILWLDHLLLHVLQLLLYIHLVL